ncbi:hypothetical protein BGX27_003499 [Mortierella sp. AM989]|nr:hypothetical protein BGX27_003499 [Mortierella sp. AM989]
MKVIQLKNNPCQRSLYGFYLLNFRNQHCTCWLEHRYFSEDTAGGHKKHECNIRSNTITNAFGRASSLNTSAPESSSSTERTQASAFGGTLTDFLGELTVGGIVPPSILEATPTSGFGASTINTFEGTPAFSLGATSRCFLGCHVYRFHQCTDFTVHFTDGEILTPFTAPIQRKSSHRGAPALGVNHWVQHQPIHLKERGYLGLEGHQLMRSNGPQVLVLEQDQMVISIQKSSAISRLFEATSMTAESLFIVKGSLRPSFMPPIKFGGNGDDNDENDRVDNTEEEDAAQELRTVFRENCFQLSELWLKMGYLSHSNDEDDSQLINASVKGWRSLHLPYLAGFGLPPDTALIKHASTLEVLHTEAYGEYALNLDAHDTVRSRWTCYKLEVLKVNIIGIIGTIGTIGITRPDLHIRTNNRPLEGSLHEGSMEELFDSTEGFFHN